MSSDMTPKEKLQDAAHRLAGAAEKLEDVICPYEPPTQAAPLGRTADPNTRIPSDSLPQAIAEGLKEVRDTADEIERICK